MVVNNKIPHQLRNENFRFVRVSSPKSSNSIAGKKPIGLNWNIDNNDKYDSERLNNWIKTYDNYGVIGGFGDLIIVDIDNIGAYALIKDKIPETFTVRTSKGYHLYYICKDLKNKIVLKDNLNDIHNGEIQNTGAMVVGPGSIHKSKIIYTVLKDLEIASINIDIINIICKYLKNEKKIDITNNRYNLNINKRINEKNKIIINEETLNDLYKIKFSDLHIPLNVSMKHPIHGSSNEDGANFTTTDKLCQCWRCKVSINPIQFLAMRSGYVTCALAGTPHVQIDEKTNKEVYLKSYEDYGKLIILAYLQCIAERRLQITKTPLPYKAKVYLGKKLGLLPKDFDEYIQLSSYVNDLVMTYFTKIRKAFKNNEKEIVKKLLDYQKKEEE